MRITTAKQLIAWIHTRFPRNNYQRGERMKLALCVVHNSNLEAIADREGYLLRYWEGVPDWVVRGNSPGYKILHDKRAQ